MSDVNATVAHLIRLYNSERKINDLREQTIQIQEDTITTLREIIAIHERDKRAMVKLLKRPYRKVFANV